MTISFDGNVSVNVSFAADVARFDGFGTVVLVVATDSSDPAVIDGDRYRIYSSAAAIDADVVGSDLPAALAAQLKVAFEQDRAPRTIILGQFDTGSGAEDPDVVLDALDADGVDFYGVALLGISDDPEGYTANLAAKIAQRRGATIPKYAILGSTLQTSGTLDGTVVESGGNLFTYANSDFVSVQYHDGSATGAALSFARLVARLGFDPDLGTAGFEGAVRGIEAYATDPTDTQRATMESKNIELFGTFGGEPYVSPGVALSGRPLAEQVTADWFAIRLAEDIRDLKLFRDATGQQIPLSPEGQELIQSAFASRVARGEAKGALAPGQSTLTMPNPIPASDISAERFSGTGLLVLLRGGRVFNLDFTATT